jgi:hypothetical protein
MSFRQEAALSPDIVRRHAQLSVEVSVATCAISLLAATWPVWIGGDLDQDQR